MDFQPIDCLSHHVTQGSVPHQGTAPWAMMRPPHSGLYDGWQVVEERDGSGGVEKTYTYGFYIDEPVTMTNMGSTGSPTYYYHTNNLYNVRALTDSSGNVVERYRYSAYGDPTIYDDQGNEIQSSTVGNRYMFQGRRHDAETGLYYYRNRYYSAQLGRFVTRDPMGYVDGYNLYEYVGSSPILYVDPMGLQRSVGELEEGMLGEVRQGPCEEVKNTLEKYHDAVTRLRNAARQLAKNCRRNDGKARYWVAKTARELRRIEIQRRRKRAGQNQGHMIGQLSIQTNAAISAGLGIRTGRRLASKWIGGTTQTWNAVGKATGWTGTLYEGWHFGRALGKGNTGEAISSGGTITGSLWALSSAAYSGPVGVAVFAGSLGKMGIQKYGEHKVSSIRRKSCDQACARWKMITPVLYRRYERWATRAEQARTTAEMFCCEEN